MNRIEVELPSVKANGETISESAAQSLKDSVLKLMIEEFGDVVITCARRFSAGGSDSEATILTVTLFPTKPSRKSWGERFGPIKDAILTETGGETIFVTMYAVEDQTL